MATPRSAAIFHFNMMSSQALQAFCQVVDLDHGPWLPVRQRRPFGRAGPLVFYEAEVEERFLEARSSENHASAGLSLSNARFVCIDHPACGIARAAV